MQHEGVIRRLLAAEATADLVRGKQVDLHDTGTVDGLAERLVEEFYRVPSEEALSLLVDTTTPILDEASIKVRRVHGLALPSTSIVNAFFSEMFLDFGRAPVPARRFLSEAMQRIEGFAAEVASALHDGHAAPSELGQLVAERVASFPGAEDDEASRLSAAYSDVLCRAFHALPLDDRRVLIARLIDDMSEADVASELQLSLEEVDQHVDRALARLDAKKAEFLDDNSEGHI